MYHHAKFCQNQPNGFGDIAFYDFQDHGYMPSWIFKMSNF